MYIHTHTHTHTHTHYTKAIESLDAEMGTNVICMDMLAWHILKCRIPGHGNMQIETYTQTQTKTSNF